MGAPTLGWEWTVRAIRARLEYRLEETLRQISAGAADGVPLPDPAIYRFAPRNMEDQLPAIYVLPSDAAADAQTEAWITGRRGVTVVARLRATEAEDLAIALMRYEAAIVTTVRGQGPLDDGVITQWRESRPGPLFEPEGADEFWESWVSVAFEASIVEDMP